MANESKRRAPLYLKDYLKSPSTLYVFNECKKYTIYSSLQRNISTPYFFSSISYSRMSLLPEMDIYL